MLKSLEINSIPPLAAFSAGIFFSTLLLSLIFLPRLNTHNQNTSTHYGNALAKMAANRATDATLNHDLVSLQVILKDVVANPNTTLATIHDVENNLLVQAGEHFSHTNKTLTFNAPIVVHDSIAGYVSVTIEEYRLVSSLMMLVLLLLCTSLCLLIWSLYDSKAVSYSLNIIDADNIDETLNASSEKYQHIHQNALENSICYCHVYIHNINVLKQQLNELTLSQTLKELEEMMTDVLALYGG